MRWLEVAGNTPLCGKIAVQGSKNSSLSLIVASCLSNEDVIIENVPDILDIKTTLGLLTSTGATIQFENNTLRVDPSTICNSIINSNKSENIRIAYYFLGALLAKYKLVAVGYPGGDKIGPRPIDQHIKGLKALGAKFTFYDDYYVVNADRLIGNEIYFDVITSGATMNIMMAATLAHGRTVIHNAARDPEVVDLAVFLNKMGAYITGAGTNTIKIRGVDGLTGCTHQSIPDRIIAGSYIMAAGITRGCIEITDCEPQHLEICVDKLSDIGIDISVGDNTITASCESILRSSNITTGMYPMFATDLQQPATVLLLKSNGKGTITEMVYPRRFNHCRQLNLMGAEITTYHNTAYIEGMKELRGADVTASDIRSGIALVLAGLCAKGTTRVFGVDHLERGFENIVGSFNALGANIKMASCDNVESAEQAEKQVFVIA
ncbi:MAG: UDP-N-acetylglucosamine 1-carboxyvinyltransferase [Oscillospiraceae bacterium]|nr:UDP-N-acetylglucosamine 1-carboxyvinyltransferase [Oscillospiraceae bacterium]